MSNCAHTEVNNLTPLQHVADWFEKECFDNRRHPEQEKADDSSFLEKLVVTTAATAVQPKTTAKPAKVTLPSVRGVGEKPAYKRVNLPHRKY